MGKEPEQQKIIAIDLLRALAALGVFYYHNHLGSLLAQYTHLSFFDYTDGFGAIYAVPLFFLISGYCIHLSNIKYIKANTSLLLSKYYRNRIMRIYPAYLVALIFAVFVLAVSVPTYKANLTDYVVHLLLLQGFTVKSFNSINLVLWTITIEAAFYLIYPLFYYLRFKHGLRITMVFIFLVSFSCVCYFTIKGGYTLPQRFFVLNLWFGWCCGAFIADKKMLQPGELSRPIYLWIYMAILAIFIYLVFTRNGLFIVFDQFCILAWTAPVIFILSRENWFRKYKNLWVIRVAGAIGLSSYSLYLLHQPLIYFKNFLVHKYLLASLQPIGVVFGIVLIPVIAWFSYCYFEKPFVKRRRISEPAN